MYINEHQRLVLFYIGLGLVLLLAAVLRTDGIMWGTDHVGGSLNIDEQLVLGIGNRIMSSHSLNPKITSYGALPFYLLALSTVVANEVVDWLETLFSLPLDSVAMVYLGRMISALASVATVLLTAVLAHRLFGKRAALLSALLFSVSLLSVREAHFATVDTLLVFLVALALLLGERISHRGSWRDYVSVGIAVGLAVSVKMVAVLVAVPIFIAHWHHCKKHARVQGQAAGWFQQLKNEWPTYFTTDLSKLITAGVVSMLVWFALNPYFLLDASQYFNLDENGSMLTQSRVVTGKLPVLYTLQFTGTTPYLYAITNWLRWGLGIPLEILALAGVAYSIFRFVKSRSTVIFGPENSPYQKEKTGFANAYLLSWFFVYFVIIGSWHVKFIRYALPLIPILCIFAGCLLVDLFNRGGRIAKGLSVVITIFVFSYSLAYSNGYLQIYHKPDIRYTAVEWLKNHIPSGSSIFVEKDEGLFFHRAEKTYGLKGYQFKIWNPYEIDGVKSVRYTAPVVSDKRTKEYLEKLLDTDYVLISSFWKERFTLAQKNFPVQAEFYRRLFTGQTEYRLVRVFRTYPAIGPFKWNDDESEITFRLFDHPAIYFFARESLAVNLNDKQD